MPHMHVSRVAHVAALPMFISLQFLCIVQQAAVYAICTCTCWRLQVVQGAKTAKITLFNNQSYDAELKGAEPDKDLAVLKILRPAKCVPISVGSSSGLQVTPCCDGLGLSDVFIRKPSFT